MKVRIMLFIAALAVGAAGAQAQTVSDEGGDIVFTDKAGSQKQITTSHLDSDPSLSDDNRRIVFVRRTPGRTIGTGISDADKNELWLALVDGAKAPWRVLAGHAGSFTGPDLMLAGFSCPQFSPDGKRVYFVAETWATSAAIYVLDVETGKTTFLDTASSLEVIGVGKHKGFLIVEETPLTEDRGRISEFWLLDQNGRHIQRIGETEADVAASGLRDER